MFCCKVEAARGREKTKATVSSCSTRREDEGKLGKISEKLKVVCHFSQHEAVSMEDKKQRHF